MARISAADLARGLKGAHFPISKEDLTKLARKNGVEDEVVQTIENLQEDEFASVAEVEHAFGQSSGGHGDHAGRATSSAQKGGHSSHGGRKS